MFYVSLPRVVPGSESTLVLRLGMMSPVWTVTDTRYCVGYVHCHVLDCSNDLISDD